MDRKTYQKEYYQKTKELRKPKKQKWYYDNKEKSLEYQRLYEKNNKARLKILRLTYIYDLSFEEAAKLKKIKECQLCGTKDPGKNEFHVDHCHKTNKVRGVLCGNCNRGLGYFKENTVILNKAIDYLKEKA